MPMLAARIAQGRGISQRDGYFVASAIINHVQDRGGGYGCAVHADMAYATAHLVRIAHGNAVGRGPPAQGQREFRPVARYAGSISTCVPWMRMPSMVSTPTRCIHPADPVYHDHPPRPTWGGQE